MYTCFGTLLYVFLVLHMIKWSVRGYLTQCMYNEIIKNTDIAAITLKTI